MQHIILSRLKHHIRQFVLQKQPGTSEELLSEAKLAEVTTLDNSKQRELISTIQILEHQLQSMQELLNSVHQQNKQQEVYKKTDPFRPYQQRQQGKCNFCGGYGMKTTKSAQPKEKSVATVKVTTLLHEFAEKQ